MQEQKAKKPDFIVRHFNCKLLTGGARRAKAVLSFTVYFSTKERPNKYVVRPHFTTDKGAVPLPVITVGNSYEEVAKRLPIEELGLECLFREEKDGKVITETWL